MLKDKELILRAVEPEDLDLAYELENETDMWSWGAITEPISRHTLRQYLERTTNDIFADGQLRLVAQTDGVSLGFADLYDFSPRNQRAEVGIALKSDFRGKGYASRMLRELANYAFRFLHLRMLYAHVAIDNVAALSAFCSAGFHEIATLPGWVLDVDGKYVDVQLLILTSDEYSA